jgi:hypothetical protein
MPNASPMELHVGAHEPHCGELMKECTAQAMVDTVLVGQEWATSIYKFCQRGIFLSCLEASTVWMGGRGYWMSSGSRPGAVNTVGPNTRLRMEAWA